MSFFKLFHCMFTYYCVPRTYHKVMMLFMMIHYRKQYSIYSYSCANYMIENWVRSMRYFYFQMVFIIFENLYFEVLYFLKIWRSIIVWSKIIEICLLDKVISFSGNRIIFLNHEWHILFKLILQSYIIK
jgi:hypothetical protein